MLYCSRLACAAFCPFPSVLNREVMLAKLIQVLLPLQAADQEWDEKGRRYQSTKQWLADQTDLEAKHGAQLRLAESLKAARGKLRDAELELAGLNAKAREIETTLYGGRVRAPRELESLEQDREHLRKRISQLEDQVLLLMGEVEDLEAATNRGAEQVRAFEAQRNAEREARTTEYQTLRARLQQLQGIREQLRSALPRGELALYDELRSKKAGIALAPMKDNACQICRVTVPALKAYTVATGEGVVTCEGCGRILYQG